MLHVIDNVLDEANRFAIRDYFLGFQESTTPEWADGAYKQIVSYGSPLSKLLQVAGQYVDLSAMVGCEYWSHLNKKSGWHKDTDETLLYRDKIESFPVCSCVYYPEINISVGGDLVFETMRIKAVTNRFVIFTPSMLHTVEDFLGERLSVAVNPWSYKPEGYA